MIRRYEQGQQTIYGMRMIHRWWRILPLPELAGSPQERRE